MKVVKWLYKNEAVALGIKPKENAPGRNQNRYYITKEQFLQVQKKRNKTLSADVLTSTTETTTTTNQYNTKDAFNPTAWNKKGYMMDIDEYCKTYNLPREDVKSYKLVTHTGTPFYNIAFYEKEVLLSFDEDVIAQIAKKYAVSLFDKSIKPSKSLKADFDALTYSDVHIGMDTDKRKNTMYKNLWNKAVLMDHNKKMVQKTLINN